MILSTAPLPARDDIPLGVDAQFLVGQEDFPWGRKLQCNQNWELIWS